MTAQLDDDTRYLTVDQVADRYGVSVDTIWRWKRDRRFPLAVRVGPGCTRWRMSDLIDHESQMTACFATNASWLLAE